MFVFKRYFFLFLVVSLFQQVIVSIQSYFKAISFINKHKLWAWLLIPGLINLLLFIAIGYSAWIYSDDLTNYVVQFFGFENQTGITILFWVMLIVLRMLVLFVFFFIYKYIILILMSPALALFAEKIHTIQTGKTIPFSSKIFINNIFRSVGLAIKNLLKELIITLFIMLLSFTGVLVPIVPILLFLVHSYYYGFSMMDYKHELVGLKIKASSQKVWKNKGVAVGNGIVFNLLLLIPFLGAMLAPMLALSASFITMEHKKTSLNE